MAAFVNGPEREEDLQDDPYTPEVYVPLVSLGKLEARMGHPPTRGRNGAAKSGWGPVRRCQEGEIVYPMTLRVLLSKAGLAV